MLGLDNGWPEIDDIRSSGLFSTFSLDTGLLVGRTLVNPSDWKSSSFIYKSESGILAVTTHSGIGLITPVSAIQKKTFS